MQDLLRDLNPKSKPQNSPEVPEDSRIFCQELLRDKTSTKLNETLNPQFNPI